jgi:sporulation protein YlmC with PRC-barrel domain
MKRSVKSLKSFTMGAIDSEIGKVDEFYFDDETWTIRYLIVNTGGWLSGRSVMISPFALKEPNWEREIFPIDLTKQQVQDSPDIDTAKPVSREQELALYDHYAWPYGEPGGAGFYGGMGMMGMTDSRVPFEDSIAEQYAERRVADQHLRSTGEVRGYTIHALDGTIGDVEDFIIDQNTWRIHFMVVDTGNWFPGKKVLISPKWIREIDWQSSSVYLDLYVEEIKNSPEYDPSSEVQETYETSLYEYYSRGES